jgi:predicted NBD/HSP70 family sugar kinase
MPADAEGASPGALVQHLRLHGPCTRRELSEFAGVPLPVIGGWVASLLEAGLVEELRGLSTGGRPAGRIAFNCGAGVVLVADLGRTHSRLAVADLGGTPIAERPSDRSLAEGPEEILRWVVSTFTELLHEADRDAGDVLGIGIGIPGPVEYGAGRVVEPPVLPGWNGVDIEAALRTAFDVPVVVDNDANAEAIGEYWTSWRAEAIDLLYVKCGTGIGCGIVLSGAIHRGADGASGEIGHIPVAGADGVACVCGNFGCLETIASGRALTDELKRLGHDVGNGREVVQLLHAGNPDAVRVVRAAGRALGEVLASAVNFFNPSVVVVGGDIAAAGDLLVAGIREAVYQRANVLASRSLRIVTSSLSDRSGVVGAAVTVLDVVLDAGSVDELLSERSAKFA